MSAADPRAVDARPAARADRRWLAFAIPALITALISATPYVTFSFHRVPLNPMVPAHIVFLSLHALAAGTALLIGPLQFVRRIRSEHPKVHRTMGAVYLLAVLIGGVMAAASATVSVSGWSAQVGFYVLDVFWIYTGLKALRAAQRRDFAWHRIWMIRNFSATFAAVLLRVILLLEAKLLPLIGLHFGRAAMYDVSVWGSITLSIFVAELFIVQRSIRAVLPGTLEESALQPIIRANTRLSSKQNATLR